MTCFSNEENSLKKLNACYDPMIVNNVLTFSGATFLSLFQSEKL